MKMYETKFTEQKVVSHIKCDRCGESSIDAHNIKEFGKNSIGWIDIYNPVDCTYPTIDLCVRCIRRLLKNIKKSGYLK